MFSEGAHWWMLELEAKPLLDNGSHVVVTDVIRVALVAALLVAPPAARLPWRVKLTAGRVLVGPIRLTCHQSIMEPPNGDLSLRIDVSPPITE